MVIKTDEYLTNIKLYMRDIIIDLQSSDTWKIQLKFEINFISSKDTQRVYSNDTQKILV